ncbi:Arginyl-tRNA--protein transferase 1 [Xylographa opegraphella]|nr:Arginyl-tRNA--protein transferase 1 [Xylographa opegraphella]
MHIPTEKCSQLTTRALSTVDGGDQGLPITNPIYGILVVHTIQLGTFQSDEVPGLVLTGIRLDGLGFKPQKDQRKAVNRFTEYVLGPDYSRLAARLCPKSREEKQRYRTKFDLSLRIHEAEYQCVKRPINSSSKKSIEPAHKFEVTLEADTFTEEKFALFANYQKVVHKEPPSRISKAGFRSFLCSGLTRTTYKQDGKERRIGSYHQCYRLDGRLVAMGVLDLTPQCVSSVYLMYHECVNDWEFGKLSALQEIALAVEAGYRYYYMGYYIHSCIKMRYKSTFHPTYVLDPETYSWDPLDQDILARLSACDYVSLSRDRRLGINASSSVTDNEQAAGSTAGSSTAPDPSSIFHTDMPGVMSIEDIKENISLGEIDVRLKDKTVNLARGNVILKRTAQLTLLLRQRLGEWDDEEMIDTSGVQGVAAEFVACIGPLLAREIVIDLSGGM